MPWTPPPGGVDDEHNQIVTIAAKRACHGTTSIEDIIAIAAEQPIIEPPAIKRIIARAAEDVVAKVGGMNGIIAAACIDRSGDRNFQAGGRQRL